MKKSIYATLTVITLVLVSVLCIAASTGGDPLAEIKADYQIIQTHDSVALEKQEMGAVYSKLMDEIASGAQGREKEYAAVLREIVGDDLEFQDSEVYKVAGDLAKLYKDIAEGTDDFGVQNIQVATNPDGQLMLEIGYVNSRGYRVRQMGADEKVYSGEQLVPYNGELGEYRIEITFPDTQASDAFTSEYPLWEASELKDVPEALQGKLHIMPAYNPDHGFVLYVGSSEPLNIADQPVTELNYPIGTVEITGSSI